MRYRHAARFDQLRMVGHPPLWKDARRPTLPTDVRHANLVAVPEAPPLHASELTTIRWARFGAPVPGPSIASSPRADQAGPAALLSARRGWRGDRSYSGSAPVLDHSFGLAETPPKPENQIPLKRHEPPAVMLLRVDDGLEPEFARYPLTPFSRVTPAYQRPLRLIVRACDA